MKSSAGFVVVFLFFLNQAASVILSCFILLNKEMVENSQKPIFFCYKVEHGHPGDAPQTGAGVTATRCSAFILELCLNQKTAK